MREGKSYLTPFWILLIISLFRVTWAVVIFYSIQNSSVDASTKEEFFRRLFYSFWQIFWTAMLLAEVIFYLKIRNRIAVRKFALLHVFLTGGAFIILPLLISFLILYYSHTEPPSTYYESIRMLSIVRLVVFWVLILAGHVFFVLLIIRSFFSSPDTDRSPDEPSGILDELIR